MSLFIADVNAGWIEGFLLTSWISNVNDPGLLKVPSMNLSTMGERAFSCTAPKLWNSLPNDIRQCESTAQFKKELKTSSD